MIKRILVCGVAVVAMTGCTFNFKQLTSNFKTNSIKSTDNSGNSGALSLESTIYYPIGIFKKAKQDYFLKGAVDTVQWEGRYQTRDDNSDISLLPVQHMKFSPSGLQLVNFRNNTLESYEEALKIEQNKPVERMIWQNKTLVAREQIIYDQFGVSLVKPYVFEETTSSWYDQLSFFNGSTMLSKQCWKISYQKQDSYLNQYLTPCDGQKVKVTRVDENGNVIASLLFPSLVAESKLTPEFAEESQIFHYNLSGHLKSIETFSRGDLQTEERFIYDSQGMLIMKAKKYHDKAIWQEEVIYSNYRLDAVGNWTFRRSETRYKGEHIKASPVVREERRRFTYY